VTDEVPASFLQGHPDVSVYLDRTAAEALSGTDTLGASGSQ
jgi:6-phosphogluconolactonase/glucosamine-6-phosphate isomerase/deaminase